MVLYNLKVVYVWYFGYFDGYFLNFDFYLLKEVVECYVCFMGGVDCVFEQVLESFEEGDYCWVVEVVNYVVFVYLEYMVVCVLFVDVFEQFGYQLELGLWCNFYFIGVQEFWYGILCGGMVQVSDGIVCNMLLQNFYDLMVVCFNVECMVGVQFIVDFDYIDFGCIDCLQIVNFVLYVCEWCGEDLVVFVLCFESVELKCLMFKLMDV